MININVFLRLQLKYLQSRAFISQPFLKLPEKQVLPTVLSIFILKIKMTFWYSFSATRPSWYLSDSGKRLKREKLQKINF